MTEAIYSILTNDPDVAFMVGTRIYPERIPLEAVYPAISFQLISDNPQQTKTGRSNFYNARVQINCFAVDATAYSGYERAKSLADVVKTALDRITPAVHAGVNVICISQLAERDFVYDFGDYDNVYQRSIDFNVNYG